MTSLGQKLYASLHTLELSLAFTTWSRAVITRYSIFFYELIAYHFFDLCMKLHRVKCRFTMHTGWCLTVNVKYSDCETTLAPSPQYIRWWLPVGSRPNEACTYVSFAFVMGGSQFEWRLERHRVFFIPCCHAKGIATDEDGPHSNTCIRIAQSWVVYRWFSFLLLSLLDTCQGSHYRMLKSL